MFTDAPCPPPYQTLPSQGLTPSPSTTPWSVWRRVGRVVEGVEPPICCQGKAAGKGVVGGEGQEGEGGARQAGTPSAPPALGQPLGEGEGGVGGVAVGETHSSQSRAGWRTGGNSAGTPPYPPSPPASPLPPPFQGMRLDSPRRKAKVGWKGQAQQKR